MTWVRLDDGFADHPKIDALSDAAYRMFVNGLCYCAQQLTDGTIPEGRIERLLPIRRPKARAELLAAGLWTATETGVEIHDYLTYQPARASVLAEREAAAERQRRARDKARESQLRHGVTNGVSNGASHGPPDPTRPLYETKSSNGSSQRAPQSDDDDLSEVWEHFAALRALRELDTPSAGWKATVARNARLELTDQARDLDARYELTRHELAQVLDAGSGNSQILRYAKRKATT